MTYEQALLEVRRVGAAKVQGLPHLALTIQTLAMVHAIAPALAYEGAKKRGLTASQVRKLSAVSLGDLMFV